MAAASLYQADSPGPSSAPAGKTWSDALAAGDACLKSPDAPYWIRGDPGQRRCLSWVFSGMDRNGRQWRLAWQAPMPFAGTPWPNAIACSPDLPAIRGLVHAAGALADKALVQRTQDDIEQVLGPKVVGIKALLEGIAAHEPDFVVL